MLKEFSDGNQLTLEGTEKAALKNRKLEFKIKITAMEVLNKRSTSNYPCDKDLINDDRKLITEAMIAAGCIPTFWDRFVTNYTFVTANRSTIRECKEKDQFSKIYVSASMLLDNIRKYYDPPCKQTAILAKVERKSFALQSHEEPSLEVKFRYSKQEYKNIENLRAFDDESLLSMTGGYIGIFLGYSLLQLPSLLDRLVKWLQHFHRSQ